MNYKTIVDVAPVAEPVTLNEAKEQLRVQHSLEDAYISSLIVAARERAESYCNRFFTEQTVTTVFFGTYFNDNEIELPYPDINSIVSVKYLDDSNATQTIDALDYYFDPFVSVLYFDSLPSAKNYQIQIVTKAPSVMASAKQAILMMVTDMYEIRTESILGTFVSMNPAVKSLLYPYRVKMGI